PAVSVAPSEDTGSGGADDTDATRWVVLSLAAVALLGGGFAWHRTRRAQHYADLAMRDDLTGVGNRRRLDRDLVSMASTPGPVSVVMIDVDHFKDFNDRHGHVLGDQALRVVADVLRQETRQRDVVYRYGGEEFCILLADTPVDVACHVAERIRRSVATTVVPGGVPLTVSLGVAVGEPRLVLETVRRADDALFGSKHAGRDRVTVDDGTARTR
ncbi:MAG: GGDEF domain-containing protein, partial [Ilumatobacteraceae bacterium]